MNEELIKRWNAKVAPDDLVYHLGDFCFKGAKRTREWESRLNGSIVHISGNHDRNNGVKTILTHAILEYGGLVIYATHIPPDAFQEGTIEEELIAVCDIILSAHVHQHWKYAIIKGKYCVNVGVDVWGFEPVSIRSILKYIAKLKKGVLE